MTIFILSALQFGGIKQVFLSDLLCRRQGSRADRDGAEGEAEEVADCDVKVR